MPLSRRAYLPAARPRRRRLFPPTVAMSERSQCTIKTDVLAQLLRGHVASLEDGKFGVGDMDQVVQSYENLLVSVAASTGRLKPSVVQAAALQVYECSPDVALHFAQRMVGAFSHCRKKLKSSTTGVKLSSSVRAVVNAMQGRPPMMSKRTSSCHSRSAPSAPALPVGKSDRDLASESENDEEESSSLPSPPKSALSMSPHEILRFYGAQNFELSSPGMQTRSPTVPKPMEVHEVLSSQDILSSQEVAPASLKLSWIDQTAPMRMVRAFTDGSRVETPLEPGESGFAVARVGGETIETEVPNILLQLSQSGVLKRPAGAGGAAPKKRSSVAEAVEPTPAAHDADGAAGSARGEPIAAVHVGEGQVAAGSSGGVELGRSYLKMWYKNSVAYGVRQKFGQRRQIFAVGGKSSKKTQEELGAIADEAILKLGAGESEDSVKAWARSAAKAA